MANSYPNTIILKVNGGNQDARPVEEAIVATAVIKPGMLIEWASATTVQPASTAADTSAPAMWAVENPYLDPRTDTGLAVDTTYAVGAKCFFVYSQPGDKLYALLETANNVTVPGMGLESNGAGALQIFSTGRIVAFSDAVLNNTTGSDARLKVRAA